MIIIFYGPTRFTHHGLQFTFKSEWSWTINSPLKKTESKIKYQLKELLLAEIDQFQFQ